MIRRGTILLILNILLLVAARSFAVDGDPGLGPHKGRIQSKPTLTVESVIKNEEIDLYFQDSNGQPITNGLDIAAKQTSNRADVKPQEIKFEPKANYYAGDYNSNAGKKITVTLDVSGSGKKHETFSLVIEGD